MLKSIETRSSIRKYSDRSIEDEKIVEILESARLAPSGNNTQPWHFVIVKSDDTRQKLAEVSHNQKWMTSAPVYVVCVADIRSRIAENPEMVIHEESPEAAVKLIIRDTTIAVEHLVLAANHLGLGTCWVAWFKQNEIRPILNVPSDKYIVGIITLGYPDEQPKVHNRKPLDEIVHYEMW